MPRLTVAMLCALALGAVLPAAASAATIHVTNQLDEQTTGNGCSLREAISAANDGNTGPGGDCDPGTSGADVIQLPASASPYPVTGAAGDTANLSGDLNISSDVTISGAGANTTAIESTDHLDRVIEIEIPPHAVTIQDVTIRGGQAPNGAPHGSASMTGNDSTGGDGQLGGFGGGIAAKSDTDITLTRVVVTGNSAGNGSDGGPGGAATTGSGIGGSSTGGAGGAGGAGGGIQTGGDLTITDSMIANNQAGHGGAGGAGGAASNGADAATGFSGGDSQGGEGGIGGSGGGIWVPLAKTLTLTRSVVQGNSAGNGGTGGGAGTPGNGGVGTSGSGGKGGCSCATDGGAGGAGGGIALEPGSSMITDSTIRNNSSGAGGAGAAAGTGGTGGAGTTVQGHGGDSEAGGGGNSGDYAGAELRSTSGNSQFVASSAIFGNTTPDGGSGGAGGTGGPGNPAGDSVGGGGGNGGDTAGLGVLGMTGTLTNVTVASNDTGAGGAGGAGGSGPGQSTGGPGADGGADAGVVADQNASVTVAHATVFGNNTAAGGSAGGAGTGTPHQAGAAGNTGLGAGVSNQSTGTVTVRNSIVAENVGPNCRGTIADGGHNLTFPVSDTSCPAAVVADPLLGSLQDNGGFTQTMALGAGSPAMDAIPVSGANCAPTDQRGMPRPQGAACDIGAFEFALPTVKLTSPTNGARYRKGAHVLASYSCSEAGLTNFIASCTGTVPNLHAINTSTPGSKTFSVVATDAAGNHVSKTVHYFVDGSAPTISIKTPKNGARFKKGKHVNARYSCSDANGRVDVRSCRGTVPNGKRIATGKTGRRSFTVVAIDRVGNRTTRTVHYTVFKKKKKKK